MRSSEPRDPLSYKPYRGFKTPRRVSRRVKAAAAAVIAVGTWTFYNVPTVLSWSNNLFGALHHGFAAFLLIFSDPAQVSDSGDKGDIKPTSGPMTGSGDYFVGNGSTPMKDAWLVDVDLIRSDGHAGSASGGKKPPKNGSNNNRQPSTKSEEFKKSAPSVFVQSTPVRSLPETEPRHGAGAIRETVSVTADQSMIVQTIIAKGDRIVEVCGMYSRSVMANGNATGDVQLARKDIEECRDAAVYIRDNKQHVSSLVASNPVLESAIRQGDRFHMFDNALARL